VFIVTVIYAINQNTYRQKGTKNLTAAFLKTAKIGFLESFNPPNVFAIARKIF